MNEIFYNIKLTFWFLIISLFVAYWNIKLERLENMHTVWFLKLTSWFELTISYNYTNDKTIYLNPNSPCIDKDAGIPILPSECDSSNERKSMKCYKVLKEKMYGYVAWKYFIPTDKNCMTDITRDLHIYGQNVDSN